MTVLAVLFSDGEGGGVAGRGPVGLAVNYSRGSIFVPSLNNNKFLAAASARTCVGTGVLTSHHPFSISRLLTLSFGGKQIICLPPRQAPPA